MHNYKAFLSYSLEDIRNNILKGSVLKYMYEYLNTLGAVEYEHPMAVYTSSIGAHILNLLNKDCSQTCNFEGHENCLRKYIKSNTPYFFPSRNGSIPELRVHIMTIAPTSFSKDYFMKFFLDDETGFLGGKAFPSSLEGRMTAAAFVGGKNISNNTSIQTPGFARMYCEYIVGIPEFYGITTESNIDRSREFETDLLEALYGGTVSKRLVGMTWKYKTFITLWGATQPGVRFNLSSGIGRRFNFVVIDGNTELETKIRQSILDKVNTPIDWNVINNLRGFFYKLFHMNTPMKIIHSPEYEEFRHSMSTILHSDIHMIDNIAYGYNFIEHYIEKNPLIVYLDETLKNMILRLLKDRELAVLEGQLNIKIVLTEILQKNLIIERYALAKRAAHKQKISFSEALRTIDNAMKDGTVGYFTIPRKAGGYSTFIFNPKLSVEDARKVLKTNMIMEVEKI
jgi:hypothetical protein